MKKYEKVYHDIKEQIKNGTLKSGDFLKKEDDLAIDYNFSKLTVRKALSMLEREGLIQKGKREKINCAREKKSRKHLDNFHSDCTRN